MSKIVGTTDLEPLKVKDPVNIDNDKKRKEYSARFIKEYYDKKNSKNIKNDDWLNTNPVGKYIMDKYFKEKKQEE